MKLDDLVERYQPFLSKEKFSLVRDRRLSMGAAVHYRSDAVQLQLLDDRGYFDVEVAPLGEPPQWTSGSILTPWILTGTAVHDTREETIEESALGVIDFLRFLEDHYPKVKELFLPANHGKFRQSFSDKLQGH